MCTSLTDSFVEFTQCVKANSDLKGFDLYWRVLENLFYSFQTVKQKLTLHVGKIRWILQVYWKRHW